MRVLIVEDDPMTSKSLELALRAEGMVVDATSLGEDGLEIGKLYDYDIILLDLLLPDMDGYEVLRRLRASRIETPVLILSGLSEPDKKIKGLGFGADDYLTKPFDRGELVARIQAIVRRSKGHSQSIIRTGQLAVNLDKRNVEVNSDPLHLTGKEYGILELLSLRKGQTLTKEQFLNHLYGGIDEPELKIIDVFICKLRKKLSTATGGANYIETVWGRGYVLRDPEDPPEGRLLSQWGRSQSAVTSVLARMPPHTTAIAPTCHENQRNRLLPMETIMDIAQFFENEVAEHAQVVARLSAAVRAPFEALCEVCRHSIEQGGKIMFLGNGGSAADAQHLATEFVVRYKVNRRALPAIALTTDTSALTAAANDFSFDDIFSRQIEALARPGDVVIGISTSGQSPNVLKALRAAKAAGAVAAGFSGRDCGAMVGLADPLIVVPSQVTARIQEMHILIGHMLCETIETAFA